MSKTAINIVWFKRDLRFTDHEPLFTAQQQNLPIVFIYFFEPSVMAYHDSDTRHWRFIYESLHEMNEKLKSLNGQIHIFHILNCKIYGRDGKTDKKNKSNGY